MKNEKLDKAKLLFSKGKYSKSLQILKKLNRKPDASIFDSLELEAACLFQEKNYKHAYLKTTELLQFVTKASQKIDVYKNLASVCHILGKIDEAVKYLKLAVELDGTITNASSRHLLVSLAFSIEDYETVTQYSKLLLNINEYTIETLLILGQSYIQLNDFAQATIYFSKIAAELRIENRFEVGQEIIIHLLNGFHKMEAPEKEREVLEVIKDKYSHEDWYHKIEQRLQEESSLVSSPARHEFSHSDNIDVGEVISGTPKTAVSSILKIKTLLESMGAKFHRGMQVKVTDGDIAVISSQPADSEEAFMVVPVKCMPAIEDYKFEVSENGTIQVTAKKNMYNPDAKDVMFLIVEIYNQCHKLQDWKKSFPLFTFSKYPGLIEKISHSRFGGVKVSGQMNDVELISSFLDSRAFSLPKDKYIKTSKKLKAPSVRLLLPFLDYANHNITASGFNYVTDSHALMIASGVGPAGREIFVRYNFDDPTITYTQYGFIDLSVDWVYTVPIVVETSQGIKLKIANDVTLLDDEQIPAHLKGLANDVPSIKEESDRAVVVSKLILPKPEKSNTLNLILTYILHSIDKRGIYQNSANLEYEIAHLLPQIFALNTRYWQELLVIADSARATEPNSEPLARLSELKDLCELNLTHTKTLLQSLGVQLAAS